MRMMHPLHGWHVTSQADDIDQMRKDGWVEDDGVALAKKRALLSAPAEDENPITIERVRSELDALGIKWDGRWSLKRLLQAKG